MPRGPLLPPAALTPSQRALYDEICGGPRASADRPSGPVDADGILTGPFNAMLYSPAVGGPLQRLGAALRYESGLPDVTRELLILAVAAHHGCAYERVSHQRVAARLGIGPEAFEALEAGRNPDAHPEAGAALDLARAILAGALPPADELDRLLATLGAATVLEINTLVGYYSTLATQLAIFDVRPADD